MLACALSKGVLRCPVVHPESLCCASSEMRRSEVPGGRLVPQGAGVPVPKAREGHAPFSYLSRSSLLKTSCLMPGVREIAKAFKAWSTEKFRTSIR